MSIDRSKVRQFVADHFTDTALRQLCFDYFPEVESEFATGISKGQKIMDLITYCEHHGQYNYLLAVLEKERPLRFREYLSKPKSIQESPLNKGFGDVEYEEIEGNILVLFSQIEQTNRELRGLQIGSEMTRTEKETEKIENLQRKLVELKQSLDENRKRLSAVK